MIEEMKYINITGRLEDIDRIINKYILRYDIHLEYALKELQNTNELTQINTDNPYSLPLKTAERFAKMTKLPLTLRRTIGLETAFKILEIAETFCTAMSAKMNSLYSKRRQLQQIIDNFIPFQYLDFNVHEIVDFKYIKYHFGRMPLSSYKQFKAFMYSKPEILFVKGKTEEDFVWCVYFTSSANESIVESIFSSFHFEEIKMQFDIDGKPLQGSPSFIYNRSVVMLSEINNEITELESKHINEADIKNEDIVIAYNKIKDSFNAFNLRKYAAQTSFGYYIFVGWIPAKQIDLFNEEIDKDDNILLIAEDVHDGIIEKAPTKLNNWKVFKPFELFVNMYGLPSYNEIDPTPFVAITYTILFGFMFGDVGQGFILFLLGWLLYKKKDMQLGKIISIIGASATLFGFVYGSVFGFKHLIPALWAKPTDNINQILILSVCAGVFLIVITMIINMHNMIKNELFNKLLFDPNGIAGIVFYISLISIIVISLLGEAGVATITFAILVPPIIFIGFRRVFLKIMNQEDPIIEGSIPMFLTETIIELFEVLLSYLTNTVSFVRVGAFALSHAGMMGVIMMLAETTNGSYNPIIVILGNILVIALEGLIVGIQALRLQFYEMFSRFFKGEGRQFTSFKF